MGQIERRENKKKKQKKVRMQAGELWDRLKGERKKKSKKGLDASWRAVGQIERREEKKIKERFGCKLESCGTD